MYTDFASCLPSVTSLSISIGSAGLVQAIDGRSCTLSMIGYKCYSTVPDQYECGGCGFDVQAETTNGTDVVGWTVSPSTCSDTACANYCCTSEGFPYAGSYWLDQVPSSSSGTGGTSSGGGSDACSTCSDACAGIPGCSCCAECNVPCYN
jgi:hypothetical protein